MSVGCLLKTKLEFHVKVQHTIAPILAFYVFSLICGTSFKVVLHTFFPSCSLGFRFLFFSSNEATPTAAGRGLAKVAGG